MKKFQDLTKEELHDLYFIQDKSKSMIANMFNVPYTTVCGRLKKFGLNKMHKMLRDSFEETRRELGEKVIMDAIFHSYDEPSVIEDGKLHYGPAKITGGVHKGRICCYDDNDGKKAYIYWGDMVSNLDKHEIIPLHYISSSISTYDLVKRDGELSSQIPRMKAIEHLRDYEKISELHGEHSYVKDLLIKRYFDFLTKKQDRKKTIFISHKHNTEFDTKSPIDYNMCLATDLALLGYDVWYDNTAINLGASIPCEMNKGIEKADFIILMITKEYLNSNFCNDEWMAFYQKNNSKTPNRIFPIILESGIKLPPLLAHYKYYDFSKDQDYSKMITTVAENLKRVSQPL